MAVEPLDTPTEFGGDPGLVQPLAKRIYGARVGRTGDAEWTVAEQLLAYNGTMDPSDSGSIPDPNNIGKELVYRTWAETGTTQ